MSDKKRLAIRLVLSLAFGLCVALVPLYLVVGSVPYITLEQSATRRWMKKTDEDLLAFHARHNVYPATLEEVGTGWGYKDGWGRPFRYSLPDGKPLVESLGRDGVRGVGLDADLSNRNPNPAQCAVPLYQLIADPSVWRTDSVAVACGVLMSALVFHGLSNQGFERKAWPALGLSLLVAFLVAGFGAVLITSVHIPSGH